MLVKHLDVLIQNRQNLRILIPLSGKALDIPWSVKLGFIFSKNLLYVLIIKQVGITGSYCGWS